MGILKYAGRSLRTVTAIMLGLCVISGCARRERAESEEEPYTIGVVTKSRDSEYWMSVCSGMEKAAGDYRVSVRIISPDSESNDKMQKKMIHDLIQQNVDALAISPISSYDAPYLEEAEKEGIRVVAYDTKIMADGIPYIGIDNRKAGEELAADMAGRLSNCGKVGIVAGDLRQTAHSERVEGIRSYIEKNTDIEIAFVESGYANLLISDAEISRIFSEHPDIDGIFATSGVTALGIRQYLGESPVLVMTVDAQQDALTAVASGKLAALAAQSGYEIGYETVRFIAENRENDDGILEDRILDADILTKDNIDEWQ
ncbi:MAG: substrate-binding domain-containing protein [Lachnospiraceae bacterium]|nr:substrate-binding domain-containing protein [Lachnospiraceae bacterium]